MPVDKECRLDAADKDNLYKLIMEYGHDYFIQQNELLRKYLAQNNITHGKIILSDVGYLGSMQMLLENLTDANYTGCYIVARNNSGFNPRYEGLDKRGCWINAEEWEHKNTLILPAITVFEALLLSPEGTTAGYVEKNGIAEPVLQDENDNMISYEPIRKVQNAALKYLADASKRLDMQKVYSVSPDVFFLPFVNFAMYPSDDTMSFVRELTSTSDTPFFPTKSILYYIFHPGKAAREFMWSKSKIIWLKGLLRIPFPYYGLLWLLRKVFGAKGATEKRSIKILQARQRKAAKSQ